MDGLLSALKGRSLLSLLDISAEEFQALLGLASMLKAGTGSPRCIKVLGLLFQKASTRTRVSFTVAMYQLEGQVIDLNPNVTQVSRGEPLGDTARVLGRYVDIMAIRTFDQGDLEQFRDLSGIPVINALSDLYHPCQAIADVLTVRESFGDRSDLTLTYLGDGNNVAHSLMLGCALAGINVRVAVPEGYEPDKTVLEQAQAIAGDATEVTVTHDPVAAVSGAHALYTDVWASMGQEDLADEREPIFQPYQLNDELLAKADAEAIVLHCLPAYRGKEITNEAMEGGRSRIWDQAENRLHGQKALLVSILGAD